MFPYRLFSNRTTKLNPALRPCQNYKHIYRLWVIHVKRKDNINYWHFDNRLSSLIHIISLEKYFHIFSHFGTFAAMKPLWYATHGTLYSEKCLTYQETHTDILLKLLVTISIYGPSLLKDFWPSVTKLEKARKLPWRMYSGPLNMIQNQLLDPTWGISWT